MLKMVSQLLSVSDRALKDERYEDVTDKHGHTLEPILKQRAMVNQSLAK